MPMDNHEGELRCRGTGGLMPEAAWQVSKRGHIVVIPRVTYVHSQNEGIL